MPQHLEWSEIAVRLALAAAASGLIGFNRGERGRPAGLRTTMLVCLAAAVAMIQVNLLLPIRGKVADSYVTLDLMRLPLGILSGIGFIGAGAIVRRGNLVEGVTTAATIWYVTVMGLCFGGGQIALGLAALGLAVFVLWLLKWAERRIGRECRATLTVAFDTGSEVDQDALTALAAEGFTVAAQSVAFSARGQRCEIRYDLRWHGAAEHLPVPDLTGRLARRTGVLEVEWQPFSSS
ncbi:MAG TPA: MgtC/SapB family protein [Stellaceae bacterium]|jgi:putative Mg2+ transporter-C (MgtC) family protein